MTRGGWLQKQGPEDASVHRLCHALPRWVKLTRARGKESLTPLAFTLWELKTE